MLRSFQENSRKNINEEIFSYAISYLHNNLVFKSDTVAALSRAMEQNTKPRNRPMYRSEFGI